MRRGRSGSKQVRVSPGKAVRARSSPAPWATQWSSPVLLVGGRRRGWAPLVSGAGAGTITAQDRGPKITIFKQKRRKNYRRKQGHRQSYTEVRVESIDA
jgi:large subunit ribosomal protein L21